MQTEPESAISQYGQILKGEYGGANVLKNLSPVHFSSWFYIDWNLASRLYNFRNTEENFSCSVVKQFSRGEGRTGGCLESCTLNK